MKSCGVEGILVMEILAASPKQTASGASNIGFSKNALVSVLALSSPKSLIRAA